jgi:Concanavalin A-like lectin/glucanases superfamily
MSAWIYIPTTYISSSPLETIVDNGDAPSTNDVILSLGQIFAATDGALHFDIGTAGGVSRTASAKTTWTPGWYFVAGTYTASGGLVQTYINGVANGAGSSGVTRGVVNTGHLTIGVNALAANYFSGKIDELRIYNRTLSPQEIALAYAVGTANIDHASAPTTSNAAPLSSGLVAYWPFDGNTINWRTNTVSDISGNGNTGTLNNMSTTTSPVAGKIGGHSILILERAHI